MERHQYFFIEYVKNMLKNFLKYIYLLNNKANEAIDHQGAEYDTFAIFSLINFIIPFMIWDYNLKYESEITYIRIIRKHKY